MKKRKRALIIGNGKSIPKREMEYLISKGFDFLIAADGGANTTFRMGIVPNLIIGDFDSIREDVREFYSDKTILKNVKRQSDTDIEKAIKYAIGEKFSSAMLVGASGDRLDHSFCNIGNLLKYKEKINLYLIHEKTFVSVINSSCCFPAQIGETISLYGIDEKTLITTSGLKFSLENEPLPFGVRGGTSNKAVSDEVCININKGKVIVMREFKVMRKYDFLSSF